MNLSLATRRILYRLRAAGPMRADSFPDVHLDALFRAKLVELVSGSVVARVRITAAGEAAIAKRQASGSEESS